MEYVDEGYLLKCLKKHKIQCEEVYLDESYLWRDDEVSTYVAQIATVLRTLGGRLEEIRFTDDLCYTFSVDSIDDRRILEIEEIHRACFHYKIAGLHHRVLVEIDLC